MCGDKSCALWPSFQHFLELAQDQRILRLKRCQQTGTKNFNNPRAVS